MKKVTADPCTIWGLADRGVLRPGYAGDVVVFDPSTIGRGPEIPSSDFPGGGTRWIRHSTGIDAVVVNGTVTWTAASSVPVGTVTRPVAGLIPAPAPVTE